MPLRFKDRTVNPYGLHQRVIDEFLLPAERIFRDEGHETVITSVCDGVHGSNSYHYLLGAVDLRTKHLHSAEQKRRVHRRLQEETSAAWDVLLEHLGDTQEHLHGELNERPMLQAHVAYLQEAFMDRLPRSARMP